MGTEKECPLGHVCDRCLWYIELIVESGTDRKIETKQRCVLEALMDSNIRCEHELKGIHAAVNSDRNHVTKALVSENEKVVNAIESTKQMFGHGILGLVDKLNEFKQLREENNGNIIDKHAT